MINNNAADNNTGNEITPITAVMKKAQMVNGNLVNDIPLVLKLSTVTMQFNEPNNEDAMNIKVVAGIFVPTAFTPNNDGKNDTWTIPFLDATLGATVTVFNRYGQLVYKVTGEAVNWDGKIDGIIQPSGSYVYMISFKNGIADMKGTVTIIRQLFYRT